MSDVPFSNVLAFLEEHGWVLQRTWPPYMVFTHPDHELPLLVPVSNKKVSAQYVRKIKETIDRSS